MTMFSAENRGFYINCGYGGGGYVEGLGGSVMNYHLQGGYDYSCNSEACIGSDLAAVGSLMAEDDESRINQSSSKDAKEDRDEGWLQLSIGSQSHEIKQDLGNIDHQSPQRGVGPGLNIELQLMPSLNTNTTTTNNNNSNNSHSQIRPLVGMPEFGGPVMNYAGFSFLQNSSSSSSYNFPPLQHQEIINWGLIRPIRTINTPTPSSYSNFSSSSSLIPISSSSYISQSPGPFQLYAGPRAAAPPLDFRVIQPPARPNSGIWFMLQASQNQEQEEILPQISKSYLRIKDGRMTVRLVMKYLINKLRLENESEIEIRCKGQRLLPFLTLQHVRDDIWSPRDFVTLLPNSSTTEHIMVLHYARMIPSN